MSRWTKIFAYVVLLALLGDTVRRLGYLLITGEARGRNGWHQIHGTCGYLFSFVEIVILGALIIFALYVLYYHERLFALKLSQFWQLLMNRRTKL